jgi:alanine-glyoxylate transaminase / serine-glyoxylate transaminase / serine-pyruvate transaminase
MAQRMGVACTILDFGQQGSFDLDRVKSTLSADTTHKIKAVLCVHTDTSSSVRNDIAALRQAINQTNHPALFAVDCIASFGCDPFDMDALGVDVMVSACQKGLMTPPGLGFLFWNQRAQTNAETTAKPSAHWDWIPRIKGQFFSNKFNGTAPTHHLFGLAEALSMIAEEGPSNTFNRHRVHASAIWAAVQAWGQNGPLQLNIADANLRSHSVTTILAPGHDAKSMRNWLQTQTGLTLGIGLGFENRADLMNGASVFRIGHMGHVNPVMVLGTLATLEAGLKACNIPHGKGAIEGAAEIIAQA